MTRPTRRRALAVLAGASAFPAFAASPTRWSGVVLGAEASIELAAPREVAEAALAEALTEVEAVEAAFSLYRDDSLLTRLNRRSRLRAPPLWHALHDAVDALHAATGGLFDPTVQPAWAAMARGEPPPDTPRWATVRRDGATVRLAPAQALTFNGIAQGFATDRAVAVLRRHGLRDAFVEIGEQAAMGSARRLGLHDPAAGIVGTLTLRDGAMATSSPAATPLGATGHVLRPDAPASPPLWSSATVEADSATEADALSTAAIHADRDMLRRIRDRPGVRRVVVVDHAGDVRTV